MRPNSEPTENKKSDSEKRRSLRPQTKQPVYVDIPLRNGISPPPSPQVSPGKSSPGKSSPGKSSPGKSRKRFQLGEEVLARWNDGLFYLGVILKVDDKKERCYMQFEDDSEYWALFKDITKGPSQRPEDIRCIVCEGEGSEKPNEIVLCDNCGIGYHQDCHKPHIGSEVLHPDVTWVCRPCVFAQSAKKGGASKKGPNARAMQELKKSLPYDLKDLKWDAQHKTNNKQTYCYCGGPGDWYLQMLQCARCRQWFHEACMQCLKQPLLYGDKYYLFVCALCNHGPEYLKRLEIKWLQVIHFALFNLTMNNSTKYYDLDEDILPWLSSNWAKLQSPDSIEVTPKSEWRNKVLDCLLHNTKKFQCGKEIKKKTTLWGMRIRQPPPIPQINLPGEGMVTDTSVQSAVAKMTFLNHDTNEGLPVPFRQKRKLSETEEPVFPRKVKKRRLNFTPTKSGKSHKNSNGIISTHKSPPGSDKKLKLGKKEDGSTKKDKTTLDSIIPWPQSYEGLDHPFKTVLERNQEIAHKRLKEHLLNSFSNSCLNGDLEQSDALTEVTDSDGRSMTPVDDLGGFPRKKQMVQQLELAVKKKRGRKSKAELAIIAAAAEHDRKDKEKKELAHLKKNRKLPAHAKNVIDKNTLDGMSKREIPLNQLRSSVSSYFGAADRLAQGERFKVLARRVTTLGKVQYLVEWEGLIP